MTGNKHTQLVKHRADVGTTGRAPLRAMSLQDPPFDYGMSRLFLTA
jgi:hypothetical protein